VDIDDCARVSTCKNRTFVKSDDIAFARKFPDWCAERGIRPEIDVLFIDTSHLYDHTVQEIKSWFPFLSQNSKVFFHDTNQRRVYYRQDKSMGIGWNSDRGVIRALQEYLGVTFDENVSFTNTWKGWIVRHNALCSGFTILERLNLTSPNTRRGGSNRSSSRDNDFNTVDIGAASAMRCPERGDARSETYGSFAKRGEEVQLSAARGCHGLNFMSLRGSTDLSLWGSTRSWLDPQA
jgi:hypothetical protein